jgi:hypothetical protein
LASAISISELSFFPKSFHVLNSISPPNVLIKDFFKVALNPTGSGCKFASYIPLPKPFSLGLIVCQNPSLKK